MQPASPATVTHRAPGPAGASPPSALTAAEVDAEVQRALLVRSLGDDHGHVPLTVEGTVPASLRGTLYRNGPGRLELNGRRYQHLFEGDGVVTAVRFGEGSVTGACRTVDSDGLRHERAVGGMRYGYSAPWRHRVVNTLRGKTKNTANTSVMMWQGRLFALMEAGRPTELDPETLATLGERDLGVIGPMFSAHPHRVAAHRTTYNVGLEYGRTCRLHVYAMPEAGPARTLGALTLPAAVMLHDFIVSERYLIAFVSPARVDVPRAITGVTTFEQLFRWQPEHGTEIIVAPLARLTDAVRFTVPAFYQWHFANAFDDGDEVVVDYCRYPDFTSFYALGEASRGGPALDLGGQYHRARIDVARKALRSEPVADGAWEFPRIRPGGEGAKHARTWVASSNLATLACIDPARGVIARYAVPTTQAMTEPVLVPGAGDDLWLLSLGHDQPSDRAFVAVFAADRLADGPVARCYFDHHIPITFHGTWRPA